MLSKYIKALGVFFVISSAVCAASASFVFAADEPACNLSQSKFDKLKALQNNASLGFLEEIKAELAVRKQLLGETMDCAISEETTLKTNLQGAKTSDDATGNLKNRLLDQLDNSINYSALQRSKINDLGLAGSKEFAKNFNEWRDGNYKPSAQNANNFIIWADNQMLFQSARTRNNQVSNVMTLLKVVDNDDIRSAWSQAQNDFANALKENQAAKDSLLAFSAADDSSAHIKSSLESLSSAYNDFLNLSDIIVKLSAKQ